MNGVKVKSAKEQLRMKDLEDGDIAVVTESGEYEGIVVHIVRVKDLNWAIPIGHRADERWTAIDSNTLAVRRLEPGELIEVM
jgi:hypothetical protein